MSALLDYVSIPIQLGFDLATFLAITGSLYLFFQKIKEKIQNDKIERFDKQARSVAAQQLINSTSILSKIFIHEVIHNTEELKRHCGLSDGPDLERQIRALSSPERLDAALQSLNDAQESVGKFYEELHVEKFNILPVIDSIEDNTELVEKFSEQLDNIANTYNAQANFNVALLKELGDLKEAIDTTCKENKISDIDKFVSICTENQSIFENLNRISLRIALDIDYYQWTKSFIENEKESILWKALTLLKAEEPLPEEMRKIIVETAQRILFGTYEDSIKYYAEIFRTTVTMQTKANQSCKRVLTTLSAILKYLLQKGSTETNLQEIIKQYEGEDYFDIDRSIR